MRAVTTYYADDGKPFSNEKDCLEYEAACKRNDTRYKIMQVILELDEKIWNKYYPNAKPCGDKPSAENAYLWLKGDISSLFADKQLNIEEVKYDIYKMIAETGFEKEILKQIEMDEIIRNAEIRRDFATALQNVSRGTQLSQPLGWKFSKRDICELAKLHKANKFRKKIEDLLEDCNFHYENGKFSAGEYDEFLECDIQEVLL